MNNEDFYYESGWIHRLESETHWRSYWRQQKLIEEYVDKKDKILEIGVGSGFCSNYLKSKGYSIKTLDIDADKSPDIVANICKDEVDYTYDVVLAFEVFEHIPFECFKDVLVALNIGNVRLLIFSVPESIIRLCGVSLKLLGKQFDFNLNIPRNKLPALLKGRYKLWRAHNWEINFNKDYTYSSLEKLFSKKGFSIVEQYKSKINNHVFYVLKNENIQ